MPQPSSQRTFLGHPVGLYVLFFTEMWERFSYYGMRALLILYMVNYFKWSQKDASTVYKVYTSFVYVTPILGGYLADRYLGNRLAVIIGAVLMAIGHFLMAFEEYEIFMSALIFLILGNGFFKPNMSTQVGRLYPANDGRRDGAYTIFYMGINLGAFLAPLVCGWLAVNTVGEYHSGFTMAGIGMVCGLVIYLLGQPLIKEIDPNTPAATPARQASPTVAAPFTETEAAREPSVLGPLSGLVPALLFVLGWVLGVAGPVLWYFGKVDQWDAIMLVIGGVCSGLMGVVATQVINGVRDRVVAILVLGVFVMFFWAAFEQAGNVLNIWADKHTNRYLTESYQAPDVIPTVHEDAPAEGDTVVRGQLTVWQRFSTMFRLKPRPAGEERQTWTEWFTKSINPVPTTWFQSINALAIFVLAPLFAWLWIALDRRRLQPSIPVKMALGLVLMSASMAVMLAAANQENKASNVPAPGGVPAGLTVSGARSVGVEVKGHFEPFQAGRLTFDGSALQLMGVLPDNQRDRIIEETAPTAFKDKVDQLVAASQRIGTVDGGKRVDSADVTLDDVASTSGTAASSDRCSITNPTRGS
jgi:POT family proton-dependent oligopeptide transporter